MSSRSEIIDVRVSRRILWIGAEAYPLHNIARAQTVKVVSDRTAAFGRWLKMVFLWTILGAAAVAAMTVSGMLDAGGTEMAGLAAVLVVVALLIHTGRFLAALFRSPVYALLIETAGTPRTALVSRDQNVVVQLVHQIMAAIDNPQAEFQMRVENLHVGDKIQQFGNNNVGKVTA